MFKLERLEITGFKSFADYTEIIFTGDGITAIVGPNGCGKSNVADAIAWVLGEQRVKHLRGGEMKDVIFQGARNRPPSSMAEVVMHMIRDEVDEVEPDIEDIDSTLERIDDRLVNLNEILPQEQEQTAATEPSATAPGNDEPAPEATASEPAPPHKITYKRHWRRRNLALEFAPGEAVSVTRRLYRSGESEYLLNGKICRLRDIQDLFSGTGLAGGHYAIIEQGRIGQILSAKPMDRRTIIEEAAGITKFRVRQRATEARLESARSNLSRISDIVAEIDRQVNSLRRQAAKARRYGVLREELRELLRHVYVAEDQKLATVLEETNSKLSEITELELGIADDLNKREDAARAATHEARSLEDELTTARAAAAEAVLRRDRQARECVYQKEQLSEIEKRKGEVTAEIEALTSRLVLIEAECRRLQQEDARLREEFDQSALGLRTAEESYAERLSAANAAEIEIESSRAELLSQTAIAERVREIARQLETTLERLSQQAESLAREGDRAASQHAERKLEAEKYARELGDARARVAKLQAEREMAVDAVVRGHEAVSDTEAELTRVRDEHSRASHRLESLKELDQRRAYYSPAVQLIFSPTETPRDFHFIGTLADALNVDAKWERAVEGVLGSSLQSIVVPTPDDAVRAAQWLRENNGGRASFLVAGLHGGSEEVEEVDTLTVLTCRLEERPALLPAPTEAVREDLRISDLLGAPQQLVTVLKRTLPQKMNARIAANLEDAMVKSIATGEMYVTLNGDWIASGQFVNAGDARDLEEGAGLLAFKRELRELETRAEALAREVDAAASSAKDARARMVELEDAVVLLNEAIGREEREAMAHEHTTTSLEQEVERAERHMRVVGQDSARVDEERFEVENRRAQALLEAEAAETAREAAADKVIKASALLTDLRREAEIESESLAHQRAAAAAASERRRATTAELRRIEGELADFAARVERHRMELAEMGGRSDELKLSIADLELANSSVEIDRAREEEQIADLSNRLQEARRQADEFSAELSELNRRAAEVRDSRGALEVQRAEAHARQTFVHENCQTELGQSLEDLARELTFPEEFDLEASHTRVEELRTRLEGFGGVNMMALEELAEAEQRLLFLTVQRQDIIEGISATEEALREIKRRSRERFRHAFEQINKNFSSLFQELFGGGRGEMSLIDADDVLESGIDVVAQPPGKRLQNVLLLSGGEKAMAALALVLGIFHYRPAPFCLLDEVDAPLDEANVGRFTDKVVQMSANTQFIVITHNKRTMEMARALYGVTMEEAGVSKLVSVKFE
jgi:chromosome segregation protein